jgi:fimbrial isopeptide formation D2 family protein
MMTDRMRTKRKTEEKKMSMNKNIARLAVTAGLTAALSFGGVMAPVTMAFAAEGGTGSITISQVEGNENTTFKAYQIFKATVTDSKNGGKTAQNITWASDTVSTKVIDAINRWENDHSLEAEDKLPNKPTPQEVADFITAHAEDCTAGSESTKGTRIATDNILYAVANAIRDEAPVKSDIVAGTAWTPENSNGSGYYLFVTNALSDSSKKDTGTSPIFAVVGGNAVTVTEKTSIPTVDKQILAATSDDPTKLTTGWAGVADSQIGQEVTYKLTGKVADNYASYDTYSYKFTDVLSSGLDYVDGSVEVYALNGTTYTKINGNKYSVTNADASNNNTLTVEFKVGGGDKGLKGVPGVDANTRIVVFYRAKLNASANIAGANNQLKVNPNTVTLEYSNNPMSGGTGTSASDTVEDYTYGLKINKVDLGTERALNGAQFTIQVNKPNDKNLDGKFVQEDGTLSTKEHVFQTKDDGYFTVKGLDAGKYTVTEKHLEGYADISPFDFEIVPTMSEDGTKIDKLELNMTESEKLIAGVNDNSEGKVGDNKLQVKTGTTTNTDGTFNITVGDTKQVGLPLTGLNGVTFTWIAGGAVLCIGVAHLIRSRKQAEESEQE